MDETDDAAHLQSMLDDFSEGELVDDLLPLPHPRPSKVEVESTALSETRQCEVTIYVGNLASEITEKLLETIFSEFGPIRLIEIIQSSVKCTFAYISYYNHDDANAARFTMNGKNYLGTTLAVHWKRRKEDQFPPEEQNCQNSVIWVGDLDKEVTCTDLQESFAPFGEIVKCRVVTDSATAESRGYGFVSYVNIEDAEMAITTMQGQWIKTKMIKTSWARRGNQRVRDFERRNILFLRGTPRYESYIQCQQTFDRIYNQTSMSNRTIFIGGLSSVLLNRDMLTLAFGNFGFIEDINLCNGPSPDKPGYAFIMYSTKESACNAIMCMHNKVLEGNSTIKVAWGKDRSVENYEETFSETQTSYDFGKPPFEDFQRTVQGYGGHPSPLPPPGPPFSVPLQFPPPQPNTADVPVGPNITMPSTGVIENPSPHPEDESGYHAFSYYGTYVYQEKIDEEEMVSSTCLPAVTNPQQPQPNLAPEPKQRLKSVAKVKTKEARPVNKSQDDRHHTTVKRSHSGSPVSSKEKRRTRKRKRDESYSSSSSVSGRSRTGSRSRIRCRRSRERSRSPSSSFSDRRSPSRSTSYDSDPGRVRQRHVLTSRVVRRKRRLPFILPVHHPPTAPTFSHNIHAINQSTIVSFPGSANYHHYQPEDTSTPQGPLPNACSSLPAPISYAPQPPKFLNPPFQQVQGPGPARPQSHQCYVNPHFVNHNQFPRFNNQEYNQPFTVPNPNYQHNPHFLYQHQFQFNGPNPNYGHGFGDQRQHYPPVTVYDNNYYQFQSGPGFNNNITYYPPK